MCPSQTRAAAPRDVTEPYAASYKDNRPAPEIDVEEFFPTQLPLWGDTEESTETSPSQEDLESLLPAFFPYEIDAHFISKVRELRVSSTRPPVGYFQIGGVPYDIKLYVIEAPVIHFQYDETSPVISISIKGVFDSQNSNETSNWNHLETRVQISLSFPPGDPRTIDLPIGDIPELELQDYEILEIAKLLREVADYSHNSGITVYAEIPHIEIDSDVKIISRILFTANFEKIPIELPTVMNAISRKIFVYAGQYFGFDRIAPVEKLDSPYKPRCEVTHEIKADDVSPRYHKFETFLVNIPCPTGRFFDGITIRTENSSRRARNLDAHILFRPDSKWNMESIHNIPPISPSDVLKPLERAVRGADSTIARVLYTGTCKDIPEREYGDDFHHHGIVKRYANGRGYEWERLMLIANHSPHIPPTDIIFALVLAAARVTFKTYVLAPSSKPWVWQKNPTYGIALPQTCQIHDPNVNAWFKTRMDFIIEMSRLLQLQ